ncbi:MAG: [Parasporobacterium sp.]|nr:[FeFe] hydrogenase H-cluster maturation GTPase HydF [Parasporobacterium sp.]
MGLNDVVSAERLHIGFFGLRNAGKSSVVNAVTGQALSLVSEVKGTTTDPVQKAMELLPLGPVVIIDTPGIDDSGELGAMRVKRAVQVLTKTDIAVLVVDATEGKKNLDEKLISEFRKREIPYLVVYNKSDLLNQIPREKGALSDIQGSSDSTGESCIYVSALNGDHIYELKERIGQIAGNYKNEKSLAGDLLKPDDLVILVTPIDESAPKGRMILPQQQMIREVLDHNGINLVVQDTELEAALNALRNPPRMVITDSQAFGKVSRIVPEDILLTSFSILFARYKGELYEFVKGAARLDRLQDGDRILISEGCTHHRQCNDIGTVKLPGWIRNYTGKDLQFDFSSGAEFTEEIEKYALIVHCGACMLNEKEVRSRIRSAAERDVPITNYGIAIAMIHGILQRALSPFPELAEMLIQSTDIS